MDKLPKCILLHLCENMNVKSRLQLSMCNRDLYNKLKLTSIEHSMVLKSMSDLSLKTKCDVYNECVCCNRYKGCLFRFKNKLLSDITSVGKIYDAKCDEFIIGNSYYPKYKYLCEQCYDGYCKIYGCNKCDGKLDHKKNRYTGKHVMIECLGTCRTIMEFNIKDYTHKSEFDCY